MGLLKWRDNLGTLAHHLQAFMSVDGEEIVKVGSLALLFLLLFWHIGLLIDSQLCGRLVPVLY